jgi:proteic killer suppression protein
VTALHQGCAAQARHGSITPPHLADLRSPPGNRLEALKGNRKGQHSIRINDQWRICFCWTPARAEAGFCWTPAGAEAVEITDYH